MSRPADELPPSFHVSRETRERLRVYVQELQRWQRAVNLVSGASLGEVWTRHVADCLQLADLAPDARSWMDLGSGAGLPGLVVASVDRAPHVMLVESDARKCAFLRSTAARMQVDAEVLEGRIEDRIRAWQGPVDVVTARGLAPLAILLGYAQPILRAGALGLFPKGRGFERELTDARESWTFTVDLVPSRTDRSSWIVRVTDFQGPRASPLKGSQTG